MTNYIAAVCFDSGDTLVNEGTEIRNEQDIVLRAELIEGAAATVQSVKALGYPVALVADGLVESFINVLGSAELWQLFDAIAISETLNVSKPHPLMFQHALNQLGVSKKDYCQVVMVGNNLTRDIGGANALGLISVWLDWAPRRSKVPQNALEVPQHIIHKPWELLDVITWIEAEPHSNNQPSLIYLAGDGEPPASPRLSHLPPNAGNATSTRLPT